MRLQLDQSNTLAGVAESSAGARSAATVAGIGRATPNTEGRSVAANSGDAILFSGVASVVAGADAARSLRLSHIASAVKTDTYSVSANAISKAIIQESGADG